MLTNDPRLKFSERPRFRLGEKFVPILQPIKPSLPVKVRKRDPDGRIKRPAFMKRGPKPRALQTISGVQALRNRQLGIKVRLGDEKLGKIKVKKRDADGNVILDEEGNPVMEERTVSLSSLAELFSDSVEDNIDKLGLIVGRIQSGIDTSVNQFSQLKTILFSVTSQIASAGAPQPTDAESETIAAAAALAGFGPDPTETVPALIEGRFTDRDGWVTDRNKQEVISHLEANASSHLRLSARTPIFSVNGRPILISTLDAFMNGNPNAIIDLLDQRVFENIHDARTSIGSAPPDPGDVKEGDPDPPSPLQLPDEPKPEIVLQVVPLAQQPADEIVRQALR